MYVRIAKVSTRVRSTRNTYSKALKSRAIRASNSLTSSTRIKSHNLHASEIENTLESIARECQLTLNLYRRPLHRAIACEPFISFKVDSDRLPIWSQYNIKYLASPNSFLNVLST